MDVVADGERRSGRVKTDITRPHGAVQVRFGTFGRAVEHVAPAEFFDEIHVG